MKFYTANKFSVVRKGTVFELYVIRPFVVNPCHRFIYPSCFDFLKYMRIYVIIIIIIIIIIPREFFRSVLADGLSLKFG